MFGLKVDLDYHAAGGMSWHEWEHLLETRRMRCANAVLPDPLVQAIWESIVKWVEVTLFRGAASPQAQLRYYYDRKRGMYGGGSAPAPDQIINAWEYLGQGDETKIEIEGNPKNAPVHSKKGPPFLKSMKALGPRSRITHAEASIAAETLATMTPYDPTAGGTRPIMYYLKRGWRGRRAIMRPRWPDGIAGWVHAAKPYQKYMRGISRYIISGRPTV